MFAHFLVYPLGHVNCVALGKIDLSHTFTFKIKIILNYVILTYVGSLNLYIGRVFLYLSCRRLCGEVSQVGIAVNIAGCARAFKPAIMRSGYIFKSKRILIICKNVL